MSSNGSHGSQSRRNSIFPQSQIPQGNSLGLSTHPASGAPPPSKQNHQHYDPNRPLPRLPHGSSSNVPGSSNPGPTHAGHAHPSPPAPNVTYAVQHLLPTPHWWHPKSGFYRGCDECTLIVNGLPHYNSSTTRSRAASVPIRPPDHIPHHVPFSGPNPPSSMPPLNSAEREEYIRRFDTPVSTIPPIPSPLPPLVPPQLPSVPGVPFIRHQRVQSDRIEREDPPHFFRASSTHTAVRSNTHTPHSTPVSQHTPLPTDTRSPQGVP